ncbi:bifunctional hydroxymethylpyrimidine kinase/phosphomethylpyrimidine kinase [Hydrogenophaga sp. R2]|uniref:bifunctional hydroxymethylpyrimidine kinase/phosphomethylpyrimidine kinase n=1 Tax=Hydrogenophaga sp. R2 TaxID=3132827 RepID=UPI003CE92A72
MNHPQNPSPTVIWSVAGHDSGGGAGLSADQRAADAFGVHLCPVLAAITAQSTTAVTRVAAVPADLFEAQLDTLQADLPPRAIKTGLLGDPDQVQALARRIDRLREQGPLPVVVDPVLRATTGATLADDALRQALVRWLLPRASLATPNRREALALLGLPQTDATPAPALAASLRALGGEAVLITGGDDGGDLSCDWLDTPHARGWLALPRLDTPHNHGTGCTLASGAAAAMALGWVGTDAAVLGKMLATQALRHARAVGRGAGPVIATRGFGSDPSLLPVLSIGDTLPPWATTPAGTTERPQGVYAIVDTAERAEACIAGGAAMVQLRIKTDDGTAAPEHLRAELTRAIAAGQRSGVPVVINDHWRLALELGAAALHLGQEDLLALDAADHHTLARARAAGVSLGLSSHSLWELCRARSMQPDLIACGPVWPTTTKAMPWQPQGLDNLAWWAHMAGTAVVGIGGVLTHDQLAQVARSGAAMGCVVRGLGDDPARSLTEWSAAWAQGRLAAPLPLPALPHPTLGQNPPA